MALTPAQHDRLVELGYKSETVNTLAQRGFTFNALQTAISTRNVVAAVAKSTTIPQERKVRAITEISQVLNGQSGPISADAMTYLKLAGAVDENGKVTEATQQSRKLTLRMCNLPEIEVRIKK